MTKVMWVFFRSLVRWETWSKYEAGIWMWMNQEVFMDPWEHWQDTGGG